MSFSTTFTLYRKYNTKCDDKTYDALVKRYIDESKNNGWSPKNKTDEELFDDLPNVLEHSYGLKESEYDEKIKEWKDIADHSVSGQRKKYTAVLLNDKNDLDELLTWSFTSSFSSLYDEWNMGHGGHDSHCKIINKTEAHAILQAINYLLSGEYSDKFEEILDNKWIRILAEGGQNGSATYYKYTYRNDKKMLKDVMAEEEYDIAEWILRRLKNVFETYLNSDEDYSRSDKTNLILTYSGGY